MLSLLIFLPFAIAFIITLTPTQERIFRVVSVGTAVIQLIIVTLIYAQYNPAGSFQAIEKYSWIDFSMGSWGNFTAYYWVGVDGMSLPLIFLSAVV
jgi:NADH-quinone oxidoreductase subunit M